MSQTTYQLDFGKADPAAANFARLRQPLGQAGGHEHLQVHIEKGGKAIGTTIRTVSKDGKTMTQIVRKANSERYEKTGKVLMFDKQ